MVEGKEAKDSMQESKGQGEIGSDPKDMPAQEALGCSDETETPKVGYFFHSRVG